MKGFKIKARKKCLSNVLNLLETRQSFESVWVTAHLSHIINVSVVLIAHVILRLYDKACVIRPPFSFINTIIKPYVVNFLLTLHKHVQIAKIYNRFTAFLFYDGRYTPQNTQCLIYTHNLLIKEQTDRCILYSVYNELVKY